MPNTSAPPPWQGKLNDSAFRDLVGPDRVPGAVLLAGDRQGVRYLNAFGTSDVRSGEPLSTDAVWQIMSMTKPVTSAAIMMLEEEGRIGLDQPAGELLPRLRNLKTVESFDAATGKVKLRPASGSVSVRHLLSQSAGFSYDFNSQVVRAVRSGGGDAELLLLHEPGTRWTYGHATGFLGEIVERVSGLPLDRFLQARLFEPLGMSETTYAVTDAMRHRGVAVHRRKDGEVTAMDGASGTNAAGDHGLKSTATDYFKFMRMLLNEGVHEGVRLLSARSIAQMTSNQIGSLPVSLQTEVDSRVSAPFPLGAGTDAFGLGFQIHDWADPLRRRKGSFSWSGIYNTHFWVDPAAGLAGIALMQLLPFYDPACMALLEAFERQVYGSLPAEVGSQSDQTGPQGAP